MLDIELVDLIKDIQNKKTEFQTVEVKSAHGGCPKKLYDTLSSFSNQDGGGIIVYGLDEERGFALSGVYDLNDLQKSVTMQCQQMQPPVRAVFTLTEIEGKKVASAEIPALDIDLRPCYYKGRGKYKGSYIRVGDADLPMTDYEIYSYEAFRKHVRDDERVIDRVDMTMLDQEKIESYLLKTRAGRPGFARFSDEQAYEMLNITHEGRPTLAAVMNFGIYPQGYLPQLAVTAIVVPGKEIGDIGERYERFLDNKRIEGTIAEMTEAAVSFCIRNMKTKIVIDPETGKREDQMEYPVTAIREAILNALIHRDYSTFTEGTPVQINMFSDRLEIRSPGGLYGRLTVEQLGIVRPDLRNPALAVIAEALTEAENRYSGIPTMRRVMREHGLSEPVFENRRDEFIVRLYNGIVSKESGSSVRVRENKEGINAGREIGDPEERITKFCATPKSRQEIAEMLGLKTVFYVTQRYITPLIDKGVLIMTIPDKPRSRNQKYVTR